jgi:hypothetical protein
MVRSDVKKRDTHTALQTRETRLWSYAGLAKAHEMQCGLVRAQIEVVEVLLRSWVDRVCVDCV